MATIQRNISYRVESHKAQLQSEIHSLEAAYAARQRANRPLPHSVVKAYMIGISKRRERLQQLPENG